MFISLNAIGERVSIEKATPDNNYYCPVCGEPLTIRATNSLAVKTHFAHKRGTICYDDWVHDMSEWHLSWQKQFPEQYREVVIEKDGIKHRADICINNTVIEFQHSYISGEEIAKRNDFYISCGYQVVWVFDATDEIKNIFEGSLDPMRCRYDDLCWKRAKKQFAIPLSSKVTIYLQYKIPVLVDTKNHDVDILLKITSISPKRFEFFKTIYPLLPVCFLKEYGALSNDKIPSISDIVNQTNVYEQRSRRQKAIEMTKILNNSLAQHRPKRRWYL